MLDRILNMGLIGAGLLFTAAAGAHFALASSDEERLNRCKQEMSALFAQAVEKERTRQEDRPDAQQLRGFYFGLVKSLIVPRFERALEVRWAEMTASEALADCHRQISGMEQAIGEENAENLRGTYAD